MILLVHMLLGAAIGNIVNNPVLAIILAFLGHYLSDFLPHVEYSIENITNKKLTKALPEILRVSADFLSGLILIFIFSGNRPIIYICVVAAIMPDGLSLLGVFLKNKMLEKHNFLHQEKIHYFKHKKISNFWRIFNQAIIAFLCLMALRV